MRQIPETTTAHSIVQGDASILPRNGKSQAGAGGAHNSVKFNFKYQCYNSKYRPEKSRSFTPHFASRSSLERLA